MSSDCVPPSQVSPMTCFRRKDTFSILTAPRHEPPCPGLSPVFPVQQNKNACPLIAHRVAHLPQNKPEYRNRRFSAGVSVPNAVTRTQIMTAPGLSTKPEDIGYVILFHGLSVLQPAVPNASGQAAFFLSFFCGKALFGARSLL